MPKTKVIITSDRNKLSIEEICDELDSGELGLSYDSIKSKLKGNIWDLDKLALLSLYSSIQLSFLEGSEWLELSLSGITFQVTFGIIE